MEPARIEVTFQFFEKKPHPFQNGSGISDVYLVCQHFVVVLTRMTSFSLPQQGCVIGSHRSYVIDEKTKG